MKIKMFEDIIKVAALCAVIGVMLCVQTVFADPTQIIETLTDPNSGIYCPYGTDPEDDSCDYTDQITPYDKITWIRDVADSTVSDLQNNLYDSDAVAFSYSNPSYTETEGVSLPAYEMMLLRFDCWYTTWFGVLHTYRSCYDEVVVDGIYGDRILVALFCR